MRIPRGFSDELRNQADILRVVGDYVSLKKKGNNYWACCPFHHEKSPSFSINPAKQLFKCFGCGKGGSIFDFIMEIDGRPCDRPDAIGLAVPGMPSGSPGMGEPDPASPYEVLLVRRDSTTDVFSRHPSSG